VERSYIILGTWSTNDELKEKDTGENLLTRSCLGACAMTLNTTKTMALLLKTRIFGL
jgi:hypothetical protein